MGQTLSEPVTNKETAICQDDFYKVGSSCMQGWRTSMEDSHTHILSLPDDPGTSWFSVFDGHGGSIVAKYASKHLHKFIIQRPEFPDDIPEALKQGFLECDTAMYNDVAIKEQMAGSTAITVLIRDNKIYCANAGDSRAIASRNGTLVALSNDHKPNNPEEMDRIFNAGGWVEFNRVNGNLALSRALGDFLFKSNQTIPAEKQIVTAYPEVTVHDLTEEWDFLVLACDGIWDVLTNQAVINFVTEMIAEEKYPEIICEELLGYCLAPVCQMGGLGGDNMSIIIVCLLHGKPWENLVEKCKKYHANKRASTKLSVPAFTNFDRLTAEGPFAEVSVLKAADENLNSKDSTSSSSHTSPSSSSPISADEKFETMVLEAEASENSSKETTTTKSEQLDDGKAVQKEAEAPELTPAELKETLKKECGDEHKIIENNGSDNGETSTSLSSEAPKNSIVNHMFEVEDFRDEPESGSDPDPLSYGHLQHYYTKDLPEVYDVVYSWRDVLDDWKKTHGGETRMMMTEAYANITFTMKYYESSDGTRKGSHIPFNFLMISDLKGDSTANDFVHTISKWMNYMPAGETANWVLGNHDNSRVGTRYGPERIDALNAMLLTLPGVAVTYMGEEIGMLDDKDISWEDTQDPAACNTNPSVYMKYSRDPERTPFQWDETTNAGFSKAQKTWLPVNPNYVELNLKKESEAAKSHFKFYQKLIELRRKDTFQYGDLKIVAINKNVFAYVREFLDHESYVILINLGPSNENINLKVFASLPDKLKVVLSSPTSEYDEGIIVDKRNIPLQPHDCVIFTSGLDKNKRNFAEYSVTGVRI